MFIIPPKDDRVCWVSALQELNKVSQEETVSTTGQPSWRNWKRDFVQNHAQKKDVLAISKVR
jgi:hypothetical protein